MNPTVFDQLPLSAFVESDESITNDNNCEDGCFLEIVCCILVCNSGISCNASFFVGIVDLESVGLMASNSYRVMAGNYIGTFKLNGGVPSKLYGNHESF